jgi:SagB-type dehydrogenase family enzyme
MERDADGGLTLVHRFGATRVSGAPQLAPVLEALAAAAWSDDEIVALAAAATPPDDTSLDLTIDQLRGVLTELSMHVEVTVRDGDELLARVTPIAPTAETAWPDVVERPRRARWSRFAYLRSHPEDDPDPDIRLGLSMESPLSLHRALIGQRLLPLLHAAAVHGVEWSTLGPATGLALDLLTGTGLLIEDGAEADGRLATWSFHDLLFHARSRPGRTDEPSGAQYRHIEQPPPAPWPAREGHRVKLEVPSFEDVVRRDRPLSAVIEERHSVRTFADDPPTLGELAEFLWRCQRVRGVVPIEGANGYAGVDRPYPSGGASADLELHLIVSRCEGLDPGLYAYDSYAHELVGEGPVAAARRLLDDAAIAAAGSLDPPILITITSRFPRISWKYERIAYALTLKHVGVLVQTMYLVATSMGLGACALGTGDPGAAARAFGLDWLAESSVGEMALGRDPAPERRSSFVRDIGAVGADPIR